MKQSTQQPKTLENPNIIDIKWVSIEYQKTCHKLSKTIRQAQKVSQADAGKKSNIPIYSETRKSGKFLDEKKCKNNKTISSLKWLCKYF